jgi:ribosomal protein L40E
MNPDLFDSIFKEINTEVSKFGNRINEFFEVSAVKKELDDLKKERNAKLIELGSLTMRKKECIDVVPEGEIDKVIICIKELNNRIMQKKEDLDKAIKENEEKRFTKKEEPSINITLCVNCQNDVSPDDKFCRKCGQLINKDFQKD